MNIERTFDAAFVLSVVSHPELRADLWDANEEPVVPMHERIYYLVPKVERHAEGSVEELSAGVVAFAPLNSVTWNPHIALLPEYRGAGTEALRLGIKWMFENTDCKKLCAFPPEFNTRMIRVFEKCGFRKEGYSPKSMSWGGALYGRLVMGIEKES